MKKLITLKDVTIKIIQQGGTVGINTLQKEARKGTIEGAMKVGSESGGIWVMTEEGADSFIASYIKKGQMK